MTKSFNLPDLGEGLQEAKIIQWHVKNGDTVKENDIIVTVETSKTNVDICSDCSCTIKEITTQEGDYLEVGEALYHYIENEQASTELNAFTNDYVATKTLHETTQYAWNHAVHTVAFDEVNINSWYKKQHMLFTVIQAIKALQKDYPIMTGHYDQTKYQIHYSETLNVGISRFIHQSTDIIPIRNADSLAEDELVNTIQSHDQLSTEKGENISILISNVGMMGGKFFTPLVIPPMVCTIALGRVEKRPVVENDKIIIANCLPISICVDHRVIPGAILASYIKSLKQQLETTHIKEMATA